MRILLVINNEFEGASCGYIIDDPTEDELNVLNNLNYEEGNMDNISKALVAIGQCDFSDYDKEDGITEDWQDKWKANKVSFPLTDKGPIEQVFALTF